MHIAVTGAGGMIGTAVCALLTRRGDRVRGLVAPDPADAAAPPGLDAARWGDIADPEVIEELVGPVDAVVHLAGPPSVATSFAEPVATMHAHALGTATVMQASRDTGVSRLVQVSSAEVYGSQPTAAPVAESAPLAPSSPYAAAKVAGEHLVRSLAAAAGPSAVILRPFCVYGAGSPAWSLVGTVLRQVLAGPEVLLADPSARRDFCAVGDVAEAIVAAIDVGCPDTGVLVCNVGSGLAISAGEFARAALRAMGHDGVVRQRLADRPPSAAIGALVADTTRARQALGWTATTPLETGIAEALEGLAAVTGGRDGPS